MGVILVPVADRPECAYALDVAFGLAERLYADIIGCHIRPHRYSEVRLPAVLDAGDGEWAEVMRGRDVQRMSREAKSLFRQMASQAGFFFGNRARRDGQQVAIWQERVGSPHKLMPIVGPVSDLIVVSRPVAKGGQVARIFLMEALLNSSRPVVVLPQKRVRSLAQRVTIAWNQSPEAGRAVAAGLPILRAADAVTIVTAGREHIPGPKCTHLARYLGHHGIEAEAVNTPGQHPEREILQVYRESRSDLLLMGAYSRHRLREQIFGGATDHMLRRVSIPVLMYHS